MCTSSIFFYLFFGRHAASLGGFTADIGKCHLDNDEVSLKRVLVGAFACLETSNSRWHLLCFLAR